MKRAALAGPVFFLFIALTLAACGDDGSAEGGSGGGSSTGDTGGGAGGEVPGLDLLQGRDDYCELLVAHDAECGGDTTDAECIADTLTVCLFGGMRPEVAGAIADCVLERPCDAEGDLEACIYDPGWEEPIPEQTAWRDACLARRAECGDAYADDDCYVSFLRAEGYADLDPCLDQACEQVPACTRDAVEAACAG